MQIRRTAASVLFSALTVYAQGTPKMVTVDSPLPWVEAVTSTKPQFTSKVSSALGAPVSTMLSSVLPYSVVVTNSGSQTIIGVDVRFSLKFGSRAVYRNFFYHSFSQPNKPLLPPGRSILITPLKTANAIAGGAPVPPGQGGSGGTNPLNAADEQSAIQLLISAQEVNISIDLVVAADGRTAGPDLAKTTTKLRQQLEAYSTLRSELLARLNAGRPDAEIQAWLTPMAEQKLFRDAETGTTDRYAATQLLNAQNWLNQLKAGQRSQLLEGLTASTPDVSFPIVNSLKGGLQ